MTQQAITDEQLASLPPSEREQFEGLIQHQEMRARAIEKIRERSPAEALGLEFGDAFPLGHDYTGVHGWLDARSEVIATDPLRFLSHVTPNDMRTSIFVVLHRMGLVTGLDKSAENLSRIAWLYDGSHHSISAFMQDWIEIIEEYRVIFDGEEAADWFHDQTGIVTCYRGYDEATGTRLGLSWSLERETAERFAKGSMVHGKHKRPTVLTAEVYKYDIGGVIFGRERQVILPLISESDIVETV